MEFLKRYSVRFLNWLTRQAPSAGSGISPAYVGDGRLNGNEAVARFLYSKSQFSKERKRVKPSAFDPFPHHSLSVVHTTGLIDSEIWPIAQQTLGTQAGRETVYARADVPVSVFIDYHLEAIRDDDPFERHTSIVGWPASNDETERKQRIKLLSLELSQAGGVTLVIPAAPIRQNRSTGASLGAD